MTDIKITYTKNAKGKFDFVVKQNDIILYNKTYSPRTAEMQHYMGYALVHTGQDVANEELKRNPNFKWATFEEFKSWFGSPELRNRAVQYYNDHIEEWSANPAKGW